MEKIKFDRNILIVGFGSLGQGMLPLLLRHFDITPEHITIITADERGKDIAEQYNVRFIVTPIVKENCEELVLSNAKRGDFLLNLSVNVSSVALINICQKNGILYLDTCVEPWPGGYTDPSMSISERSNYAQRDEARALKNQGDVSRPRSTAVIAHGANPGIISHFLKEALLNVARDVGYAVGELVSMNDWAHLAQGLGIKVIHIAERDTQTSAIPKRMDEFVNTWSIDGFCSEGNQPSELGWGTHEKNMPYDGRKHTFGCDSAIYLEQPGFMTKVRSWTPTAKAQHAWMITHNESISIADFLTVKEGENVVYRPTVHYAYHPCSRAVLSLHELAGKNGELQGNQRLMVDEILPGGIDELGVLLMGHDKNAYWYGSRLSIDETRKLVPHTNATGLQVTSGILGAMVWMIQNPEMDIVEADEMDYRVVMDVARPYLGEMVGEYTDWTPLSDRGELFPKQTDSDDSWQFINFRVS